MTRRPTSHPVLAALPGVLAAGVALAIAALVLGDPIWNLKQQIGGLFLAAIAGAAVLWGTTRLVR